MTARFRSQAGAGHRNRVPLHKDPQHPGCVHEMRSGIRPVTIGHIPEWTHRGATVAGDFHRLVRKPKVRDSRSLNSQRRDVFRPVTGAASTLPWRTERRERAASALVRAAPRGLLAQAPHVQEPQPQLAVLQRAEPLWCKPQGCKRGPGPVQQPRHHVGAAASIHPPIQVVV